MDPLLSNGLLHFIVYFIVIRR